MSAFNKTGKQFKYGRIKKETEINGDQDNDGSTRSAANLKNLPQIYLCIHQTVNQLCYISKTVHWVNENYFPIIPWELVHGIYFCA